jgi:hypothetical protein
MLGHMAKQGTLCGHTLDKSLIFKGNDIAFHNRWATKTEATKAAWQCRMIAIPGLNCTNSTADVALGTNSVVLCLWPQGTTNDGGESNGKMAEWKEEEAKEEAEDCMMTLTIVITITTTGTSTETSFRALATND